MKKILLISLSDHYTFQETVFKLKEYIEKNTDNKVFIITSKKKTFITDLVDGVFRVDYNYRTINPFYHIKTLRAINKTIKSIQPESIVFVNASPINLLISNKFKGTCDVYNIIHDVLPHEGDKNSKSVAFYNHAITKRTNYIIVHSKVFVELFSKQYKFDKKRVLFTELWREFVDYREPIENKTCLFFGRINLYKGIEEIEKLAKLNPNIKFNVVGKWDKVMEEYKTVLAANDNVFVDDGVVNENKMEAYFTNCELVLLPYKSATQSGVIIDANKFSRPTVVYNVGGLFEQIEDGKSGFLINSGDTSSFSKQINDYLNSPLEQKNKITKQAWEYGYKKYSTQGGYVRLIDLLENGEQK